jgi:hypothetical protein
MIIGLAGFFLKFLFEGPNSRNESTQAMYRENKGAYKEISSEMLKPPTF